MLLHWKVDEPYAMVPDIDGWCAKGSPGSTAASPTSRRVAAPKVQQIGDESQGDLVTMPTSKIDRVQTNEGVVRVYYL